MIENEKFEELSKFDELVNLKMYHEDLGRLDERKITF